ncbi:tetratricopeptide repeat protein [Candidatus Poribacteria bacterium]|nr:tetratricopeptide repeat protein [Candidatus Poribacteria bacterium]
MNLPNLLKSDRASKLIPLLAVFLLAFAVRMEYLREIRGNPFFHHLMIDENAYDQWAQRIAGGELMGKEIFYQDPLYPYFLGLTYSVIGRDLLWVRVLQLFVGSLSCALICLLGSLLFDRSTGFLAGVIAALYKPFFYFEAMIEKTFLAIFLLSLFLLLLVAARPRRSFFLWVAGGFTLGLLALVRANTLALAGGVFAWLLITQADNERAKHKLIAATGFFAGLLLLISPICARNYIVGNDFVLVTSQAGQNFYIGNNPRNLNGRYQPPIFIRPNPKYEQEDFRVRAEIVTGRRLGPSEVSAYWFGEAFRFIADEPLRWLQLLWTKTRLFWNYYEVPDNQNYGFFKRYSYLLRQPLPDFRIVAAVGLTGMALCVFQWKKLSLLYLTVIIYSITVIAFYVFDRYRVPVVPLLIVFAASAPVTFLKMIRQKAYLRVAAAGGFIVAIFLLLSMPVNPNDYYNDDSNAYCRLGAVYQAEGKLDDALAAYESALKILPYYWAAHSGLGEVYEEKGNLDRALVHLTNARILNPGSPDLCVRIGRIYYLRGDMSRSAEAYEAAARLDPDWSVPHTWLADIYLRQGDVERAQAHARKLMELGATDGFGF